MGGQIIRNKTTKRHENSFNRQVRRSGDALRRPCAPSIYACTEEQLVRLETSRQPGALPLLNTLFYAALDESGP